MLDYKITLKREVLREKSVEILSDLNRHLMNKNVNNERILKTLKAVVREIYINIFKTEYGTNEKLDEANGKLDLVIKVLNCMN